MTQVSPGVGGGQDSIAPTITGDHELALVTGHIAL
jgi:hypothetical protein